MTGLARSPVQPSGLLAFLLAFVVGFGFDVYGQRRALVLDEANAIRSTYLRAGYLDGALSRLDREIC